MQYRNFTLFPDVEIFLSNYLSNTKIDSDHLNKKDNNMLLMGLLLLLLSH